MAQGVGYWASNVELTGLFPAILLSFGDRRWVLPLYNKQYKLTPTKWGGEGDAQMLGR